jgi:GNAT superfamily N-acetyltransferase
MTAETNDGYDFVVQEEGGDEFKRYLQGILNEYDQDFPAMQTPRSKRHVIRVRDAQGAVVGGAIVWTYWGWLEINLMALEKQARGRGLGRRLLEVIEETARAEGCTHVRTEAFDYQALGFYLKLGYRIVGHLEDYPEGFHGKKPGSPGACAGEERPRERSSRCGFVPPGFFPGSSRLVLCWALPPRQGLASRSPTACGGELHFTS